MFCTFFRRKWGTSDFLALRAEVRWPNSFAKSSLFENREDTPDFKQPSASVCTQVYSLTLSAQKWCYGEWHKAVLNKPSRTCLYVLSATLSRKKKSQMRHTRTTKLTDTITITMISDEDPKAMEIISLAKREDSCSRSLFWKSLYAKGVSPRVTATKFPKIW